MLNTICSNWEYDLYDRLDAKIIFTAMDVQKFTEEILWCCRFGYIDFDQRDCLLDYLKYRIQQTEKDRLKRHDANMARIKQTQEHMKQRKADRQEITEVFRSMR